MNDVSKLLAVYYDGKRPKCFEYLVDNMDRWLPTLDKDGKTTSDSEHYINEVKYEIIHDSKYNSYSWSSLVGSIKRSMEKINVAIQYIK